MSLMQARQWDKSDPLAAKRDAFYLPPGKIYVDGNSLGPLPLSVKKRLTQVVDHQWGEDLITSWNQHQWITLAQSVGARIAPLIGAKHDEVICADSTSINLFKLLCAALNMRSDRSRILSEKGNFPTDLYMAQGLESLIGNRARLELYEPQDLLDQLDESVAVVMLTQVNFRSGRLHDMAAITKACHKAGALVIWDLAHSAGALPVDLNACEVDMAVGCGYKYLNGGPGAPAFAYVAKRHHSKLFQPLTGWMGHASPFSFETKYTPAKGLNQLLVGTPSVLALSALDAALEVFDSLDMQQLRKKSVAMTQAFVQWIDSDERTADLQLGSPRDPAQRGSQLAWHHPHAYSICQAMIERGVIADFRAPDILRMGFTPLYLSFEDIWLAKETLAEIMAGQVYLRPRFQHRQQVT